MFDAFISYSHAADGKLAAALQHGLHRFAKPLRWVLTGSGDKTARLWDLSAKDPAANPVVLRGHQGEVWVVAVSADNRWVVTGSSDKTARLWLLHMNDLVHLARDTVGRNFSDDEWRLYFPGENYRKTFPDFTGGRLETPKSELRVFESFSRSKIIPPITFSCVILRIIWPNFLRAIWRIGATLCP